jgi:hypothetical protein
MRARTRAHGLLASLLAATLLLAACGPGAPVDAGVRAGDAGGRTASASGDSARHLATTTGAREPGADNAGTPESPAPAGAAGTAPQSGSGTVDELPLLRGFYVVAGTPCEEASTATLSLLRRDGFGYARDSCVFTGIVRTGPATYRVTESCGNLQGDGPGQVTAASYEIPNDTSFTATHDSGWVHQARHCSQSALPEPWRTTDIGDVLR